VPAPSATSIVFKLACKRESLALAFSQKSCRIKLFGENPAINKAEKKTVAAYAHILRRNGSCYRYKRKAFSGISYAAHAVPSAMRGALLAASHRIWLRRKLFINGSVKESIHAKWLACIMASKEKSLCMAAWLPLNAWPASPLWQAWLFPACGSGSKNCCRLEALGEASAIWRSEGKPSVEEGA